MSSDIKEATNFDECVSNKISVIADEDPEMDQDQRVAIAFSHCRKKFGISKANILFILDKSQLFEGESLEQLKATIEKGMNPPDWVSFAAILKKEGWKHKEICERVSKSETWIKKYVNPIFKEVTSPIKLVPAKDTNEPINPNLPIHTILKFTVTEIKKETRTFGGWGSVEVLDSQEEVVSIEGLEAIMPTYMKRGAPIQYGHSNKHVGNVFKYKIKDKLVKDEYMPALWLEGRIFSDYKIDDLAWEAIQYAYSAGLPVLSLGATPIGHPEVQCNDSACFKKYNEFQLYEFTVTEQQRGSIGANPEATIEVAMAKSKEGQKVDDNQKKGIGEYLSKLEKSSTLPQSDLDFVNMMLATCDSCQDEYKQLLESGSTEEQAKESLLKQLVDIMNSNQGNENENSTDVQKNDLTKEAATPVMVKEGTDLAVALTKINDRLDNIELSITKTTSNPANTNAGFVAGSTIIKENEEEGKPDKEEEEAKKADETPKEPAQMTLSNDFEKQMDQYLKNKGLVRVGATPVPDASEGRSLPEITKKAPVGDPNKQSTGPTLEEELEAIAKRNVTGLAAKYGH